MNNILTGELSIFKDLMQSDCHTFKDLHVLHLLECVLILSANILKYLEICLAMIVSFRWIIFVGSGSHIKMADKLVLVNKKEVSYTIKTSSYSSMKFI